MPIGQNQEPTPSRTDAVTKFFNAEGKGMDGKGMKAAGFNSQFPCRLFRCPLSTRAMLPVRKGLEPMSDSDGVPCRMAGWTYRNPQ